jgi:hypothetical protein
LSLAAGGTLPLTTRARALGDHLPLIDDGVTVEHLLAQRSGIGDYLDENEAYQIDDVVLAVPVHTLAETIDYLTVLDGCPKCCGPANASLTTTEASSSWPSSPNELSVPTLSS